MRLPFFLARRFVAAETLEETFPVVDKLKARNLLVALDLLGEYVDDRNVAAEARDNYIELIERMSCREKHRGLYDSNISIKLSMMGQKIDYDFCLDNLRQLLDVARKRNMFVRLDMEGSDVTESTLRMFEEVYPDYPENIGIVLQAYLKRTRRDVERMCELGARVRLCKGAYKEPPEIAHQDMPTIRERFIEYMQLLLSEGHYPGIATHDEELIQATLDYARKKNVDADNFEFQMLYGMRPERQEEIVKEGYRMRVYVPYGTEWFPYFYRRLRERKENVWFVLRHLFSRG